MKISPKKKKKLAMIGELNETRKVLYLNFALHRKKTRARKISNKFTIIISIKISIIQAFYFIFCLCLACVCFRLLFGLKLLLVNFVVGLVKFILEFRTIKFFIAFKKIDNIVDGSNCKFIETNC